MTSAQENSEIARRELATQRRVLGFGTHVLPVLAYAGAVFYSGLIPLDTLPESGFVPTDKLLHTLAFGGLALLLARALRWLRPSDGARRTLILAGLGSSLLGLLLELCQTFVSYRSGDTWDWVADTIGAALAVSFLFAWLSRAPKRAHG